MNEKLDRFLKLRELEYSRTFNLGQYESEKIGLTVDLDPSEDIDEAFRSLKARVFSLHQEGKLLEESKAVVEDVFQETKYDETAVNKLPWETKTGSKGEYEQTSKQATNNHQDFQTLRAIVEEKDGFCILGSFKYWQHQSNADIIDRRRK